MFGCANVAQDQLQHHCTAQRGICWVVAAVVYVVVMIHAEPEIKTLFSLSQDCALINQLCVVVVVTLSLSLSLPLPDDGSE